MKLSGDDADFLMWRLHNWSENIDKEKTILISIPLTVDYPIKYKGALKLHAENEKHEQSQRYFMRNLEDKRLVWIREDSMGEIDESINYLSSICQTIDVFLASNWSDAVGFVLKQRQQRIYLLIEAHTAVNVIDKISHASHVTSIFIYTNDVSLSNNNQKFPKTAPIASCGNNFGDTVERVGKIMELTNIDNKLLFYKPNQKRISDASDESAAFVWHLLLVSALEEMPTIGLQKLCSKASDWYCMNPSVLQQTEDFKLTYDSKQPQKWLVPDSGSSSFVQRMLQQAFKRMDMDIILPSRFFIIDLAAKISSQCSESKVQRAKTVFFSQYITRKQFEFLKQNPTSLVMSCGFLIANIDRQTALSNIQSHPYNSEVLQAVLFIIQVVHECSILMLDNGKVIFNIGTVFCLRSFQPDLTKSICNIEVHTSLIEKQAIIEENIHTRISAGQGMDEGILFASTLSDVNHISAAIHYLVFYSERCLHDDIRRGNALAEIGRIALRCYRTDAALKAFRAASTIQEYALTQNHLQILRLRLDIVLAYCRLPNLHLAAGVVCRGVQRVIFDGTNPVESLSLIASLCLGRDTLIELQKASSSEVDRFTIQKTNTYNEYYSQNHYQCGYPSLIVETSLELGDLYRKKCLWKMAYDCYFIAWQICQRNQPFSHLLNTICLERLLTVVQKVSVNNQLSLVIELELVSVIENSLGDINDEENKHLADLMFRIAERYETNEKHEYALSYITKCYLIYLKQWPPDYVQLHRCQAFLGKEVRSRLGSRFDFSIMLDKMDLFDYVLSAEFEYGWKRKQNPDKVNELQKQWGELFFASTHKG